MVQKICRTPDVASILIWFWYQATFPRKNVRLSFSHCCGVQVLNIEHSSRLGQSHEYQLASHDTKADAADTIAIFEAGNLWYMWSVLCKTVAKS